MKCETGTCRAIKHSEDCGKPFARGALPIATAKFVGDVGAILTAPYRFARLATITKAVMPTDVESFWRFGLFALLLRASLNRTSRFILELNLPRTGKTGLSGHPYITLHVRLSPCLRVCLARSLSVFLGVSGTLLCTSCCLPLFVVGSADSRSRLLGLRAPWANWLEKRRLRLQASVLSLWVRAGFPSIL